MRLCVMLRRLFFAKSGGYKRRANNKKRVEFHE